MGFLKKGGVVVVTWTVLCVDSGCSNMAWVVCSRWL